MKCPKCGYENPEGARFCNQCGTPLIKPEVIKKEDITEGGERKNITVLFADISGFTAISEKLDPEDVQEILNEVFSIISELVKKYGGSIDKFVGDEAMVLFGVPVAYENHVERAIKCAIEIKEKVKKLKDKFPVNIRLHMGIHTGEVVVGNVGSNVLRDTTVIGDTVNLASRLESMAPPGAIYTSKEVVKKARAFADFVYVKKTEVKGKSLPVKVYLLEGLKSKRESSRGLYGIKAPMVGREKELEILIDTYFKVMDTKKLKVVLIEGDAGIGKSRLQEEFLRRIGAEGVLKGRFLPFGTEAGHPVRQILRGMYGTRDDMPKGEAVSLINGRLSRIEGITDTGIRRILEFMGYMESESDDPKKAINEFLATLEIILKDEARKVLLLSIEDMHWADNMSLRIFEYMVKFLSESPIMLLFMTRNVKEYPDIDGWIHRISEFTEPVRIRLKELSFEDANTLISKLLAIEELPDALKSEIVEKSGGNPLFIEELIKSLMEKGYIFYDEGRFRAKSHIRDFRVPENVSDIVISRVDMLSHVEKEILRVASVIGRVFWKEAVMKIMEGKGHNEAFLSLVSKEFVRVRESSSFEHVTEYFFKHVLIQEAIYRSVLKKLRRMYHLKFAEWLITQYPDKKFQFAPMLAYHFEKAEDYSRAIEYYKLAGDLYSKSYAHKEAISAYNKALSMIRQTGRGGVFLREIYEKLGSEYALLGEFKMSSDCFEDAIQLSNSRFELARVRYLYADALQKFSVYDRALTMLELALKDAKQGDRELEFSIYGSLLWINYLTGNIEECTIWLDKMVSMMEYFGESSKGKELEKKWASVFRFSAILKSVRGDYIGALEDYKMALEVFERYEMLYNVAALYNNMAGVYLHLGRFSKAIGMYKKSLELEEKLGNKLGVAIATYNLGESYSFLNMLNEAEEYLEKYMSLNRLINNTLGMGYGNMGLSEVYYKRKKYDIALKFADRAIEVFENLGSKTFEKYALLTKTAVLIEMGQLDVALHHLDLIQKFAGKIESKEMFASAYLYKGILFMRKGNLEKSEFFLKQAEEILNRLQDIQRYRDFYVAIVRLYVLMKKEDKASYYRERLKLWIDRVISGIEEEEIRKNFLEYEDFKEVIKWN